MLDAKQLAGKNRKTSASQIVDSFDPKTRRDFIVKAGAISAALLGGGLMNARFARAQAVSPDYIAPAVTDADILNFALNLEYLEAEFYLHAVYGTTLPNSQISGTGTLGAVTGGSMVTFSDSSIQQFAQEIAQDEQAHVVFLRSALGSAAVARPAINIGDSFTIAAQAAGIITSSETFSPYVNDDTFLLGAFVFEDVGVTAYHGAAALIQNKAYLTAAAGILGTEAYHASLVRTNLFLRGQTTASDITDANLISALRAKATGRGGDDAGITDRAGHSNIVPTDANAITYARSTAQVLDVVYLGGRAGNYGFFPSRMNGNIR